MPRLFWYSRFPVLPGHLLFKGVAALGVALLLAGGSLVQCLAGPVVRVRWLLQQYAPGSRVFG